MNSQKWCNGCGICVVFCPEEALFINSAGKVEKLGDMYTAGGVCGIYCPDFVPVVGRKGISANGGS